MSSIRPVVKPTKSAYKGGLGKRAGHQWTLENELTRDRLIGLLCVVLLPISVGLYGAGIGGEDLVISQGDGQNVFFGKLGYQRICFTGVDSSGNVLPEDCATIDTSCSFSFSPSTQSFMAANYNGLVDSSLHQCSEFNAYRAFHVMGTILAGVAFIFMIIAHVFPSSSSHIKQLRIYAFCIAFSAGISGVIAHCLFIDWWNISQQYLITLAFLSEASGSGSTPLYVTLDHSFFDLVGGWVCALCSALFYVFTFSSATK
jgi:hypothetical protein